jgi:hypothetical protein
MNNLRFQTACASLFWLTIGTVAGGSLEAASSQSPNFVVILTDDQSWVGTSLQIDPEDARTRSDYYRTPQIERLAELGMSFTQGYSPAPFCCPTRRSLLIGQTPARCIYQKDQRSWTTNFRKQLSLPQMLKQANPNYRTAHFGKWDMRFDEVAPAAIGYDVSDGVTGNGTGGGKDSGGPSSPPQIQMHHGRGLRCDESGCPRSQPVACPQSFCRSRWRVTLVSVYIPPVRPAPHFPFRGRRIRGRWSAGPPILALAFGMPETVVVIDVMMVFSQIDREDLETTCLAENNHHESLFRGIGPNMLAPPSCTSFPLPNMPQFTRVVGLSTA